MVYVLSQYGQMYLEQHRLAEQWQQEQRRSNPTDSPQQAYVARNDGMIRLVIPKIELTSFVVEGTSHRALLLGPGHLTQTSEPGEVGNSVISGHRDTFFRHLHELERGDQVFVDRAGKRYVYQVTGKKIVEPDDMSVTRSTTDSELTLITCYPTYYIGPAPRRLVVFTKLSSQQETKLAEEDDKQEKPATVQNISTGLER
jgi:sortase A